ncbi:MAG TPA: alkaline phosphatase family protein [Candidatus Polarisedimenticolia bacterium]|nr:alkaline phosphatase family protein [Candidatus Polarisedimenticolia bacterium]
MISKGWGASGRGRQRWWWGAAGLAAALLAAALWRCVLLVPSGSAALIASGGEGRIAGEGIAWRAPWASVHVLPAGESRYSGRASLRSPEGATLAVPFELRADPASASAAWLGQLAAVLDAGGDAAEAMAATVSHALQETAAGVTVPPGRDLLPALSRLGLTAASLDLGEPAAGRSVPPHPLAGANRPVPPPVLLIGIDAADWDIMTPMMAAGRLPNLRSLRDRGSWGVLRSMKPTLSPILWTTMATGRPPEEHGVLDFLVRDDSGGGELPISRLSRRVKALWNIAGDLGVRSATVAWWATWPAESVLGSMVTDRLAYTLFDLPLASESPGAVFPPDLAPAIDRLRVRGEEVGFEELSAIVPIDQASFDRARAALDGEDAYRDPVSHLIKILAGTLTYHRIALHLLREERPGLALIYFQGVDEVNHRFAHYAPPALRLTSGEDPARRQAFAGAVERFYELQDRLVGELVAAAPGSNVLVVSDHGFANGRERPLDVPPDIDQRPGMWHTMDGVFILAGPAARPGRLAADPDLLDVAPTVLALLGLPKADDMPGRVVAEALDRPVEAEVRAGIASYDTAGPPLEHPGAASAGSLDAEMMARLEALGYIRSGAGSGAPGDTAAPAAGGTATATYHVNAGLIFLQKNDLERARARFEQARALAPGFDQPLLGLAQVELLLGSPDRAVPLVEEALRLGEPQPALFHRAARVFIQAGRQAEGIEALGALSFSGRREGFRLAAVGLLQESLGRQSDAIASYGAALRADPSIERALQGAYRLMRPAGQLDQLAALLEGGRLAESPSTRARASNWLALTREAQGRRLEAVALLERTLEEAPDDVMTLVNLGSMLVREDRSAEALPLLERALRASPASHEALVGLIVARGKLGDLAAARSLFAQAGERPRPEAHSRQLLNAAAYAEFLNGAMDEAEALLSRSLAMEPDQPDALKLREEVASRRGAGRGV